MDQKKTIRPFSMKDKIGYTLGDLGCCFTEQYRAMYLSIFYTLILQVNPFHVGILLLITKIWAVHPWLCQCGQYQLRPASGLHVRHLRSVRGAVHLRQRALRYSVQRDDR